MSRVRISSSAPHLAGCRAPRARHSAERRCREFESRHPTRSRARHLSAVALQNRHRHARWSPIRYDSVTSGALDYSSDRVWTVNVHSFPIRLEVPGMSRPRPARSRSAPWLLLLARPPVHPPRGGRRGDPALRPGRRPGVQPRPPTAGALEDHPGDAGPRSTGSSAPGGPSAGRPAPRPPPPSSPTTWCAAPTSTASATAWASAGPRTPRTRSRPASPRRPGCPRAAPDVVNTGDLDAGRSPAPRRRG